MLLDYLLILRVAVEVEQGILLVLVEQFLVFLLEQGRLLTEFASFLEQFEECPLPLVALLELLLQLLVHLLLPLVLVVELVELVD